MNNNQGGEAAEQKLLPCPFCQGEGCCFCDHSGRISVGGENDFFSTEKAMNDSLGVKFLKEMDNKNNGGTEAWPEMVEHFLIDNNVPQWYKQKINL